jgi:3-oxoacyl-[acyl-carrier-protein] synthase-3
MRAVIKGIEYYLPSEILDNGDLAAEFPGWSVEKVEEKTGIRARHIASNTECSSDLGVEAAERLFARGACRREDVDFLLLCTQSPDYILPTTACTIQQRLGLSKSVGALDFNLGCSGFVYGLGLAKGLIETGQARGVLLITAETYSKFLHPADKSVRTLFGDAAAGTFVQGTEGADESSIGPFVYGTDGSGADKLMVAVGGMRTRGALPDEPLVKDESSTVSSSYLYMDGPEIFNFALWAVPDCVRHLLALSGKQQEDIDLFVFHQANKYMLDHLRKKLNIPEEKFVVFLETCGNTVSSTIPIALKEAMMSGVLKRGQLVMLVGFGVGLSWAATLVRWEA